MDCTIELPIDEMVAKLWSAVTLYLKYNLNIMKILFLFNYY
jgi:hypothetical protein